MEIWIVLSVAAAAFQTVRFVLQKKLSMGPLSAGGSTLARFLYSVPFVVPLTLALTMRTGSGIPEHTSLFWPYAIGGGLAQIVATWCVIVLFAMRNFAVGVTLMKTEVIQAAILGYLLLGDKITALGITAIILGLVGVLLLARPPGHQRGGRSDLTGLPIVLGLTSGTFFAISAVGYRAATLEIASSDPLLRATLALCVVTVMQTVILTGWLRWHEPGQVGRVITAYRSAVWIGLMSMAGSLCWFTAFTLQNAALVFAVGQIEVLFSLFVATLVFGEKITRREGVGITLITLSVVAIVLWR